MYPLKKKGRLTIQCDEMWWSVSLSNCRLLAIKATNSGFGLLLMSKPARLLGFISVIAPNKELENFGIHCQVYTCAVAYTDFWRAYALVFPAQRHKAVGKESGKTN